MNNSKIETLNNTGTIGNSTIGIKLDKGTIENLNNEKSAYIRGIQLTNNSTIKSLENSGVIGYQGVQVSGGSSKIENLTNNKGGQILGAVNGIKIDQWATINTITNSGTIKGEGGAGIRINANSSMQSLVNSGTIYGKDYGIYSEGTIENIINSGFVTSQNYGIVASHKFGTILNDTNGVINTDKDGIETIWVKRYDFFSNVEGELIENKGTINAGGSGIKLFSGSNINTINNFGVINAKNHGIELYDTGWGNNTSIKVQTINNSGTIIAKNDGIAMNDSRNQNYTLSTIENINNTGLIQAGRHGIHLSNTGNTYHIKTITNNGTILGQSGAGIFLGNNKHQIKDYIKLEGKNALIAGGSAGIHNNGTIGANNNGSSVNNGNVIDLKDGATIAALSPNKNGGFNYNTEGNAILNNGLIKGNINLDSGSNIYGKINNSAGTIQGNIALNNKSNIFGGINNSKTITGNISLDNNSSIYGLISNNKNAIIQGSLDLKNGSYIESIVNNGTIQGGINLEKSTIGSIENSGTIGNGGIKLNESQVGSITNNKGGKADLTLENNSVVGTITNNGDMLITRDETSSIGKFANNGNLKNTFENKDTLGTLENSKDAILEQGLVNDNGIIGAIDNAGIITSINNTLNNKTKDDKDKAHIGVISNTGTIGREIMPLIAGDHSYGINNSGTIDMLENTSSGVIFSGINNSGAINLSNQNDIYGGIANSGTINLINASVLNTTENDNNDKAKIYGGINNEGTMSITNYGEINGGITNSGTLTLSNGYVHSEAGNAEWEGGTITKSSDGYHIKNENGGKISIDGWYFDALEYTQSNEQRKENSIIVGGDNIKGISADKIYVNTKDLELKTVYDSNTFFADKEGNGKGNETNNGAGVDANNIFSLSGIYDFINTDEKGKYVASLNVAELSGKTLAKSMVYSSRLRSINISNILRDVTTQNFQTEFSQVLDMQLSKKGEAYGNDADLLAELEDIFIPNKNIHAKNHSFLIPYYNHSSIKIGKSVGQLSANTTGLIGGSQRSLPNDYGIIGFYLGYEDASKEQATQRLKFDDKTYYGGLTYYGVIARDGIDQYYISASTRLDYTTTDIEKSYKDIPATIKSDTKTYGYGVDVKVGANYYNTLDIARISPELGLSYYGMSNKNFALKHLGGTKEHYMAEQFNFIDASAALKWYKPWSDKIRTNVTIGAMVNLYSDTDGKLKLDRNILQTEVETSKYYGFGQFGLSYNIADNADLSLNYAGAFTFDNTTSHTMFLKLGLWW
ncbi:hypothetical protein G5F52_001203 [Campylobacter lari]|nr:hypothetical protein [Campylobacter lari]